MSNLGFMPIEDDGGYLWHYDGEYHLVDYYDLDDGESPPEDMVEAGATVYIWRDAKYLRDPDGTIVTKIREQEFGPLPRAWMLSG